MGSDQPDIVPVTIAAERLDISTEAVRKRIQRGTLPGRKIDGTWFLEASALPPSPSGRPDVDVLTAGPASSTGRTTTDAQPDIAPLADLITNLTRENQELSAAAAVWQYRALRAEETVAALQAGPIAADVQDAPQEAPQERDTATGRGDWQKVAPGGVLGRLWRPIGR